MKKVPEHEIVVAFARSGGPGGQNVNKTSTKAQARWAIWLSPTFTEYEKNLIRQKLANRITAEDELLVESDETRSQSQNKALAFMRLQGLIFKALTPEKPRLATKPTRASKERRLEHKKRTGQKKTSRKPLSWEG